MVPVFMIFHFFVIILLGTFGEEMSGCGSFAVIANIYFAMEGDVSRSGSVAKTTGELSAVLFEMSGFLALVVFIGVEGEFVFERMESGGRLSKCRGLLFKGDHGDQNFFLREGCVYSNMILDHIIYILDVSLSS